MIGEKIRGVRQSQGRSLADVASKAKISVATLSRIETEKQAIDVDLLVTLAGILGIEAAEVLRTSSGTGNAEALAQRIAGLGAKDRADLWREVAAERRSQRSHARVPARDLAQQVEEMLAQLDFVRAELEALRPKLKKTR